jgi:multidrug efflux pump subunit AcrA (membrane-fusion protein)
MPWTGLPARLRRALHSIPRKERGKTLLGAIRSLRPWQAAALVLALAVGIGVAYAAYRFATGTEDDGLDEDQQLYAVAAGDLVNEVSVSGSLVFPNRETLSFGVQGTVGRVAVGEGDSVAEGQPLAVLDEETIATLEKAVAQAEVNLRDAQDALDKALTPHTPLDVAQAEADAANAEADLKDVEEDLAELVEPPSAHALAKAEANIASARLSVTEAEDALEASEAAIEPPSYHEVLRAEAKVTDARVEVAEAFEDLKDLLDGSDQDAVSEARSKISSARNALRVARLDLALTRDDWSGKLDEAADTLEEALDAYADVFLKWLGIELTETERNTDADTLLEYWNADLASLLVPEPRFADPVSLLDDPATRWDELTVYIWANFFPGKIVASCDAETSLVQGESCIKREMDDAWEEVGPAVDNLETLKTEEDKAVSNVELVVTGAEEDLVKAEEELVGLFVAPGPLDIESKRMSLALAKSSLQESEDELAELNGGPGALEALETEDREKQLALAKADLTQAGEELAGLLADPDAIDVTAGRKKVELANAKLADARESLAEILEGADPVTVALREADVTAASAALASARSRLAQVTLIAPWAAVVSAIEVEPGQQVSADTEAFEIVDQSIVEMDGVVDEIDVLLVREGSRASVTMDALPGQVLKGVVSEIATDTGGRDDGAFSQQGFITGVVRYAINIRVEAPPGLELPEGLSAVASVVVREDRDVLLVPLDAVSGSFEQPVLRVMRDGEIEERAVSLGNSDDFWVVVEEGITEGEIVVMQYRQPGEGFGFPRGGFRPIR